MPYHNAPVLVNLHQPKLLGTVVPVGQAANGDVGVIVPVVVDKLHVVHAVTEGEGEGRAGGGVVLRVEGQLESLVVGSLIRKYDLLRDMVPGLFEKHDLLRDMVAGYLKNTTY